MVPVSVRSGEPVCGYAERHSRSGDEGTGLDPDRHRGRFHAEAGRGAPAAHRLQPRPGLLQFRRGQPALAFPGSRPSGRMSSWTSPRLRARPSSSTTTPRRLSRRVPRPTTSTRATANQMDAGGAPTTQPGYGPNTRTIMQIRVDATSDDSDSSGYSCEPQGGVRQRRPPKRGVFEVSQDPIIIPQAAFNSAYNNTFTIDCCGPVSSRSPTRRRRYPTHNSTTKTWS